MTDMLIPDALRPTGGHRNVVGVATIREALKHGGWREARRVGLLPPMAGGALTLVDSGTTTPVVGTNSTVSTDTPGTARLYVVEVDCENMRSGDHLLVQARRGTATMPVSAFAASALWANTAAIPSVSPSTVIPAGAPVLYSATSNTSSAPVAPTDSQAHTWASLGSSAVSPGTRLSMVAATKLRRDGAIVADWLNDQVGLAAALNSLAADTVTQATGNWVTQLIGTLGLSLAPAAYGGANGTTSATTSSSVAAGDLVVAVASNTTTTPPTLPGGWSLIGSGTAGGGGATAALYAYRQAPGGGAVTFTPGGTVANAIIAALPAQAGLTIGKAVFRGDQSGASGTKQSIPFLIDAGEQVGFDLLQIAGTARAFGWRLWHL